MNNEEVCKQCSNTNGEHKPGCSFAPHVKDECEPREIISRSRCMRGTNGCMKRHKVTLSDRAQQFRPWDGYVNVPKHLIYSAMAMFAEEVCGDEMQKCCGAAHKELSKAGVILGIEQMKVPGVATVTEYPVHQRIKLMAEANQNLLAVLRVVAEQGRKSGSIPDYLEQLDENADLARAAIKEFEIGLHCPRCKKLSVLEVGCGSCGEIHYTAHEEEEQILAWWCPGKKNWFRETNA